VVYALINVTSCLAATPSSVQKWIPNALRINAYCRVFCLNCGSRRLYL